MIIDLLILCHIQLIGKNHGCSFQVAQHLSGSGGLNLRFQGQPHIGFTEAGLVHQVERLRGEFMKDAVEGLHLRQ